MGEEAVLQSMWMAAAGADPWGVAPTAWNLILRVLAVLVLLALVAFMAKRWGGGLHRRSAGRPLMHVVDAMALGPQRGIYLIRVGERGLVVGVTSQRVNLLMELPPEETNRLEDEAAESRGSERFLDILRRQLTRRGDGEASETVSRSRGGESER